MSVSRPIVQAEGVTYVLDTLRSLREAQEVSPALEQNYRLSFRRFIYFVMASLGMKLSGNGELRWDERRNAKDPEEVLTCALKDDCEKHAMSFLQSLKASMSEKTMIAYTSNLRYGLKLLHQGGFTDFDADTLQTVRRNEAGKEIVFKLPIVEAMLAECFDERSLVVRRHNLRQFVEFVEAQAEITATLPEEVKALSELEQHGAKAVPRISSTRTGAILIDGQTLASKFMASVKNPDSAKHFRYALRKLYAWLLKCKYVTEVPVVLQLRESPRSSTTPIRLKGGSRKKVGAKALATRAKKIVKSAKPSKAKALKPTSQGAKAQKPATTNSRPHRRLNVERSKNLGTALILRDQAATSLITDERLSFNQVIAIRMSDYDFRTGLLKVVEDKSGLKVEQGKPIQLSSSSKAMLLHYRTATRPTALGSLWGRDPKQSPLFFGSDGGNYTADNAHDADKIENAYFVVRSAFVTALVQNAGLTLREVSDLVRADLPLAQSSVAVKRKKKEMVSFDDRLRRLAREFVQISMLTGLANSWTGEESTTPLIMSADRGSLLVS